MRTSVARELGRETTPAGLDKQRCHQSTDDLLVVELDITNLVSAEAAARPRSSCSRREDAYRETIRP
jgi:hypothetical protein